MVYNTVSVKAILYEVTDLYNPDASLADSMLEWIGRGLGLIGTPNRLEQTYCVKEVKSHGCLLPKGLQSLSSIIYNGARLPYNEAHIDPRIVKTALSLTDYQDLFKTDVTSEYHINQADYNLVRGLDLAAVTTSNSLEYYSLYPNHIQTSFETGTVIFIYKKIPIDKEGYPVVPDHEAVKEALFWFLTSRLLIKGYKPPSNEITIKYADEKFRQYKQAAKRVMRGMNKDKIQHLISSSVHLIPPDHYHSTFFAGTQTNEFIDFTAGTR